MKDHKKIEYREDGTLRGTLTYSDKKTDGYIEYMTLSLENSMGENPLISVELQNTTREEGIEVFSRMLKMDEPEAWEYFLKIFPVLLEESCSYKVRFIQGFFEYHVRNRTRTTINLSDGKVSQEYVEKKGYFLVMESGRYKGQEIELTSYLRKELDSGEELDSDEQKELYERYIEMYRDLFSKMKNGTMDNFLLKAKMLGVV